MHLMMVIHVGHKKEALYKVMWSVKVHCLRFLAVLCFYIHLEISIVEFCFIREKVTSQYNYRVERQVHFVNTTFPDKIKQIRISFSRTKALT